MSRWSRHPRSVGRARVEFRKELAGWGLAGIEEAALIVLSELLTNAVRHASTSPGRQIETRCSVAVEGGAVRIEVHDTGDGWPHVVKPGPEAVGGRGLWLVEALADGWGVANRMGPGKCVWAELSVPDRPPAPKTFTPGP
ncbi:ATP-binding protein [Streptomyces sp. NPDC048057]|uniref:ATP-binding protein n=1 Tax=Streptomyces sp. NPDC048057 TaxID=3155628 RepID=UPI0033FEBC8D